MIQPTTWRELEEFISGLSESFMDCCVAVSNNGEYHQVVLLESMDDDILSDGHPYLEVLE